MQIQKPCSFHLSIYDDMSDYTVKQILSKLVKILSNRYING